MNGLQKTSIIQTVTVMKNQEGLGHSQARREQGDKTKNCEGVSVSGARSWNKGHLRSNWHNLRKGWSLISSNVSVLTS